MKKLLFIWSLLLVLGISCTLFNSCSSDTENLEEVLPPNNEEDKELKCYPSGGPELIKICGVKIDTQNKKAYVLTWSQPGYEVTMINWGRENRDRLGNYCDAWEWEIVPTSDYDRLSPYIPHDDSPAHKLYKFNWAEEYWDGGVFKFCLDGTNGSSWGYYVTELPYINGTSAGSYPFAYIAYLYNGNYSQAYDGSLKLVLNLINRNNGYKTSHTKTFEYGIMRYGDIRNRSYTFNIPHDCSATLEVYSGKGTLIRVYNVDRLTSPFEDHYGFDRYGDIG